MSYAASFTLTQAILVAFFIIGTSQLVGSDLHCSQSVLCSSPQGRSRISFASTFSVQHWLVCCICSRRHASFSCCASVIHRSLYSQRKRVPFAWRRFSTGGQSVRSEGFYRPLLLVASPHESDQRLFSQPHWVSRCALLLHSLYSCPSRVF